MAELLLEPSGEGSGRALVEECSGSMLEALGFNSQYLTIKVNRNCVRINSDGPRHSDRISLRNSVYQVGLPGTGVGGPSPCLPSAGIKDLHHYHPAELFFLSKVEVQGQLYI